eukprot:COSAG06_NODE_3062_length_5904_cov_62.822911_1_plen_160_part_00
MAASAMSYASNSKEAQKNGSLFFWSAFAVFVPSLSWQSDYRPLLPVVVVLNCHVLSLTRAATLCLHTPQAALDPFRCGTHPLFLQFCRVVSHYNIVVSSARTKSIASMSLSKKKLKRESAVVRFGLVYHYRLLIIHSLYATGGDLFEDCSGTHNTPPRS